MAYISCLALHIKPECVQFSESCCLKSGRVWRHFLSSPCRVSSLNLPSPSWVSSLFLPSLSRVSSFNLLSPSRVSSLYLPSPSRVASRLISGSSRLKSKSVCLESNCLLIIMRLFSLVKICPKLDQLNINRKLFFTLQTTSSVPLVYSSSDDAPLIRLFTLVSAQGPNWSMTSIKL